MDVAAGGRHLHRDGSWRGDRAMAGTDAGGAGAPDAPWDGPWGLPDWAALTGDGAADRFRAAFRRSMTAHLEEVAAVRDDPRPADFANVVAALERSGRGLRRTASAFFTLAGCASDDDLRAVEREVAPALARHASAIWMDPALAARVAAVADDGLDAERREVLRRTRERFERSGAGLAAPDRARLAEIMARLSELQTGFGQAVLAAESDWALPLSEDELAALPEALADAARAAGAARGVRPCVTLARASVEPFLAACPDRTLRERAWRAWVSRGTEGDADNRPAMAEILALRAERAALLGFPSFAAFRLAPEMARTPEAVRALLERVWAPARARAARETARLSELAREAGEGAEVAPWDRRRWAEAARARDHAVSDADVRPYLSLEGVLGAAFAVAGRLFGLAFREVEATLHHPSARAFEVRRDGRVLGLFVGDWFARSSKRSGAWMSQLVAQERLDGEVRPVVLNVANFAEGAPALLSRDDARTLFHEFGHALHGLMSDVTFPSVAGTGVARDFVELPSQLFERWLDEAEILAAHARHWRTGEPIPPETVARLKAAEAFGAGFRTVEYLESAFVDLEMHAGPAPGDPAAFEAEVLARLGAPEDVPPRHGAAHFLHVFAGEGYAAGYYGYLWAEVMEADAFAAFEEAGGAFAPGPSARLAELLAAGGSRPAEDLWLAFRGRAPDPAALLRGRGFAA